MLFFFFFEEKKCFFVILWKEAYFCKGGEERKIPTTLKRLDLQPINTCRVRYAHVQWTISTLLHSHTDRNTDTQTRALPLHIPDSATPPCKHTPTNSQPNFRHMHLDSVSPAFPKHWLLFRHWSKHNIYRATHSCPGSKCSLLMRW